MKQKYNVVVERDSEGWLVASVPGLINKILSDLEVTRDELRELL